MPLRRNLTACCVAVALLAAACSGDDDSASAERDTTASTTASTTTPPTTVARPQGPSAELSDLGGGNGVFMGEATGSGLDGTGYVEKEYTAAGTATAYTPKGELTGDGRWTLQPGTTAPYRTRMLVRMPSDASKFSGTVVVEWLNVSGGLDADPDWASMHEEVVRSGDAWVGVSAQRIGVMGGPVAVTVEGAGDIPGKGLVKIDPVRYGKLQHPGDGYAYDIFTQVARAVRAGDALGDLQVKDVIAAGESQSAFALVTYVNGFQPITREFDGFLVHSRGAPPLPMPGPGEGADIAGAISGTPTIFRTDQHVPIMDVQTESDVGGVLASAKARQPDTDWFRLWEVAGTAHADKHLAGAVSDSVDCGLPINDGPMHVVVKAAFHALKAWVRDGTAPPKAPRFQLTADGKIARDGDGIALGGVRTPPVDVPVEVLSGEPGPNPAVICILLGSTRPLPPARIAALYASRADYTKRFDADAEKAVAAGFVLKDDLGALRAYARPDRVTG